MTFHDPGLVRIALFGHFGAQNLGNECTLQAMLCNIRDHMPTAEVYGICSDPEDTRMRHGIAAIPLQGEYGRRAGDPRWASRGRLSRMRGLVSGRIPGELRAWRDAVRALRGTRILAITGTGVLTDASESLFGLPYEIFKWACAARLARCRVRFVAVGVERIRRPLTKRLLRSALALADYRSYRDDVSRDRVRAIGVDTTRDAVVPDLAFSLPPETLPVPREVSRSTRSVVGVGVMDYYGFGLQRAEADAVHEAYVTKMCQFVAWLLRQGHTVRMLHGDIHRDRPVRQRVRMELAGAGLAGQASRLIDRDVLSVPDLLAEVAATDVVVAPRFHNLLLALLLHRPVVSISYETKNDALLAGFGLEEYCEPIERLDVARLIARLTTLRGERAARSLEIRKKTEEYRACWNDEFSKVLA
jgi:polysaccharide pyruvyl transferase WcaK-like protein